MHTAFYRIKRLPPYIFEEVNPPQGQPRAPRGEDIIDFGMAIPDMATTQTISWEQIVRDGA